MKADQKRIDAEQKAKIEDMKKKGRNRPMLMDGGGDKRPANLAKLEKMKTQIEIMKEFGEKPKFSPKSKELLERDELERKFKENKSLGKK
jgi:hypothetical protein